MVSERIRIWPERFVHQVQILQQGPMYYKKGLTTSLNITKYSLMPNVKIFIKQTSAELEDDITHILTEHFLLNTLNYTLHTIHLTKHTIRYTLYTLNFSINTIHFTPYTLYFLC